MQQELSSLLFTIDENDLGVVTKSASSQDSRQICVFFAYFLYV